MNQKSQNDRTAVLLGRGPVDISRQVTLGTTSSSNPGSTGFVSNCTPKSIDDILKECRLTSHVAKTSSLYEKYNPNQTDDYRK